MKIVKDKLGEEYVIVRIEKTQKNVILIPFLKARNNEEQYNNKISINGQLEYTNNVEKFDTRSIISMTIGSYLGLKRNPDDTYDYFEMTEDDFKQNYSLVKELDVNEIMEELECLEKYSSYGRYRHKD